jgi:hypothetical protein
MATTPSLAAVQKRSFGHTAAFAKDVRTRHLGQSAGARSPGGHDAEVRHVRARIEIVLACLSDPAARVACVGSAWPQPAVSPIAYNLRRSWHLLIPTRVIPPNHRLEPIQMPRGTKSLRSRKSANWGRDRGGQFRDRHPEVREARFSSSTCHCRRAPSKAARAWRRVSTISPRRHLTMLGPRLATGDLPPPGSMDLCVNLLAVQSHSGTS